MSDGSNERYPSVALKNGAISIFTKIKGIEVVRNTKGLSRNDVTFLGGEGGQPKSDEKWSGGGGVSALLSKPKVTSFLDGPLLKSVP